MREEFVNKMVQNNDFHAAMTTIESTLSGATYDCDIIGQIYNGQSKETDYFVGGGDVIDKLATYYSAIYFKGIAVDTAYNIFYNTDIQYESWGEVYYTDKVANMVNHIAAYTDKQITDIRNLVGTNT